MEGLLEAVILALVAQVGLEAIGGQPVSSLPLLGPVAIGTVLLLLPIAVFSIGVRRCCTAGRGEDLYIGDT